MLSSIARRRLHQFRRNRRGYVSFWIFLFLFVFSCGAELIANDKPIVVSYDHALYFPVVKSYPETAFGGEFETEADYRDPVVQKLINDKGWMLWPMIHYSYQTINYNLDVPAPSPPSAENWLGTDDQGRDVTARLITASASPSSSALSSRCSVVPSAFSSVRWRATSVAGLTCCPRGSSKSGRVCRCYSC